MRDFKSRAILIPYGKKGKLCGLPQEVHEPFFIEVTLRHS